jgi:hypothetical protein
LATALQSVEGAKVVAAPKPGKGPQGLTVIQVDLGGKATLGAVAAALEKAATPHKTQAPPGVVVALPVKLKADVTPEAIMDALKKANLTAT